MAAGLPKALVTNLLELLLMTKFLNSNTPSANGSRKRMRSKTGARSKSQNTHTKLTHKLNTESMKFLFRIIGNMLGIWVTSLFVSSITFQQDESLGVTLLYLAVIALILALVNSIVGGLVKILTFPLYLLTFGLFAIFTNGIVFAVAAWISTSLDLPLTVGSSWGAILGGTITAIVSTLIVAVFGSPKK